VLKVVVGDQFICDEDLLYTECSTDLQLGDARDRRAPGARHELHGYQLRGHGCLAVRREPGAVAVAVILERRDVVSKVTLPDDHEGQGKAPLEDIPTLRTKLAQSHRDSPGHALVSFRDGF